MLLSQWRTRLDGSLVADREALISQHTLMASRQWQHPFIVGRYRCTRLGLVQTGWMSLLPSALHTFLPDPAQTRRCNSCSPSGRTNVLLQQHPPRGELCVSVRGVCSQQSCHQVAPQVFSHQRPPLSSQTMT